MEHASLRRLTAVTSAAVATTVTLGATSHFSPRRPAREEAVAAPTRRRRGIAAAQRYRAVQPTVGRPGAGPARCHHGLAPCAPCRARHR